MQTIFTKNSYSQQPITALHLCLRLELIPCTVLGAAIIHKAANGPAVPLLKEITTQAADNYALMAGIVGEGLLRDIVNYVAAINRQNKINNI